MPSHEEEANTTLRRKATDLAKQKWSTKAKIWIGTMAASIPIVYALIAGFMWIKTEVAWAEDVKQSQNIMFIQNQQDRTDDQMWKVKHDLEKIEERAATGQTRLTDSLDKQTLLEQYKHLITQKSEWAKKEKEATQ